MENSKRLLNFSGGKGFEGKGIGGWIKSVDK